jgi:Kdo2-lipid IVA lauroyltransferase/acyltransferase
MTVAPAYNDPDCAALQESEELRSLWRFSAPRYWPAWLLVGWLRLTASLPWRFAIASHKRIGWLAWRLMSRHRLIVERNLELCFPELDADEVRRLVRQHFESLGACLAETAFAWFGKVNDSVPFHLEGDEHVYAALAKERGVILYTGHFTPLEICAPVLNESFPKFGFMFHARRNPLINEIQRRGRRRSSRLSVASNDVRTMLYALKRNAVIWYAPDQNFSSKSSIVLPFFGEPAAVNTATARLARISGAAIVPFSYQRLPGGEGYELRFEPALEAIEDDEASTRRLLEILERFIRDCPDQYAWTHRRLKHRPTEFPEPEPERARRPAGNSESSAPDRRSVGSIGTRLLAILGVALFITAVDNGAFFVSVYKATAGDENQAAIMLSMLLLVMTTLIFILSLAGGKRLFKLVASLLLISGAAVGYLMSNYGFIVETSTIPSLTTTNAEPASALVSPAFITHLLGFGFAPALLVGLLPLGRIGWRRELGVRASAVVGALLVFSGTLYANYGAVSVFAEQNRDLRMQINPVYPLYAFYRYATGEDDGTPGGREGLSSENPSKPQDGQR